MPEADDVYLTRRQAAFITGVSPDAIGQWHARGWLAPDGEGGTVRRRLRTRKGERGWLEYNYRDLVAAERDTRASGNSRRRYSAPPSLVDAA